MQRILIVDDNKDIQEVLGTYVAKAGFEPVTANDGFEALDVFKKTNPAVILLDVMMPGMDGYRVCETIRKESDGEGKSCAAPPGPCGCDRGEEGVKHQRPDN